VRAQAVELEEEPVVQTQATIAADIGLRHPIANAVGIELVIPGRIERIVTYTRLPSRLISTICGAPLRGLPPLAGCGASEPLESMFCAWSLVAPQR
jgi:hypothetical protein